MSFEIKTKTTIILPKGEPIFSERATEIELCDEAGGEFLTIRQDGKYAQPGEIRIDAEEWPFIRAEIDRFMNLIEHNEP